MLDIRLSSGLTVTASDARIIFRCCLWDMLGGGLVKDGWVWAESPCSASVFLPTYVPVRRATERDHAIWTLLQPKLL